MRALKKILLIAAGLCLLLAAAKLNPLRGDNVSPDTALAWSYGQGISREGEVYSSPQCMATDYIDTRGNYLHYYTYGYAAIELRVCEYGADGSFLNCSLVSGNACGEVALMPETESVRLMLADWTAAQLPDGFETHAVFDWQDTAKGTYYFAADGDDAAPGTEASPKKSPEAFIAEGGSIVRLKGGDTFRTSLRPGSDTEITNYGSGMAMIDGTRTTEGVFEACGENLYRVPINGDVGYVWLDGGDENWARRKTVEELQADGDYCLRHAEGYLYMRSDTDLTGQRLSYTAGADGLDIHNVTNVRIMYLEIKKWGWHGVSINRSRDVRVSECIVENIGGGQIHGTDDGLRFGNAIEVGLYGCSDINIYQNIIRHIYDSGLSPQTWAGTVGDGAATNILFDRNYVSDAFWGFEFATDKDANCPSSVSCRGNFFHDMRDITDGNRWQDPIGPAFFCIGTSDGESRMTATGNNCLGTARYGIMYYTWANASGVWFSGNSFTLSTPGAANVRTETKYHAEGDSWDNPWQASGGDPGTADDESTAPSPAPEGDAQEESNTPAPDTREKTESATPTPDESGPEKVEPEPTAAPGETAEQETSSKGETETASVDVLERSEWADAYTGGTKWEAGHAWTMDGEYVAIPDGQMIYGAKIAKNCISAMPPECPILVSPGEEWHIKTNLWLGGLGYTAIIVMDKNDDPVYIEERAETPEDGVRITIPEGGAKLYITYANSQPFALEKTSGSSPETEIMDMLMTTRRAAVPESRDTACIAFVIDDSRSDMDVFADIFMEHGIPLNCAVFPENLMNCMSQGGRTVSDVLRQVEAAGGEVICHSATPVTSDNQADTDFMLNQFAWHRMTLDNYGFDVNGILLAGGAGSDTIDRAVTGRWAELFYAYSDYGTEEPHYHKRTSLRGVTPDAFKARVQRAMESKEFLSFYWHDSEDVSPETMRAFLDYMQTLPEDKVRCVTYRDVFQIY